MKYIGEHLFPGQLGHFAAVLSFVACFVATISFFKSNRAEIEADKKSWLKLARLAFAIETASVITIISCIYYILVNHLFEYNYAWEHSDTTLQPKYVFACLWEAQEGSFLLWSFWHCVLGWILIATAKKWEAGVLTVISFAQFCLATMLIGIYVFHQKIGINPFALLRTEGLLDNAPVFTDPDTGKLSVDYLSRLTNGSGLNALLQNYWMVIHPPVLFLGFASTIVPFSFAFAGLVNNDHSWTKPVLPWAAFSGAVLSTGVMMGAAWAYESLSFGGYWAWDPVENASLVPWLVLIAGLHTNVIYKNSGYSLKSTYVFYILTFSLVLYSTFLTRSGILGDTSVHAFVGADIFWQLILFILVFFIPGMVMFFMRVSTMPTIRKEESTYTREFWMFIGSLVLFLSSFIIMAKTSVPVFNKIKDAIPFIHKLFQKDISPPEDVPFSYNQIQVFIVILLGVLTAITQYLKYKETPKAFFVKRIWLPTLISLVISLAISFSGVMNYDKKGPGFMIAIHVALFAAIYGVVANVGYIWIGLKGKLKAAGASVAHIGFALLLVGILISSSKKEVLSWNTTGVTLFEKSKTEDPAENIALFQGIKTDMGKYNVTYERDTSNGVDRKQYFELNFQSKDGTDNFKLYPDMMKINKGRQENSANPDKKHYWNKDIFAYASASTGNAPTNDTTTFRPVQVREGDTVFYSNGMIILNKVMVNPPDNKNVIQPGETAMQLDMVVYSKQGSIYTARPGIAINGNAIRNLPDTVLSQGLVLQFNKVADEKNRVLEIGVKENRGMTPLITLKVYQFPFISLVWIAVIIMGTGFIMSIVQRVKSAKLTAA